MPKLTTDLLASIHNNSYANETLDLSKQELSVQQIRALCTALENNTHIKELVLSGCQLEKGSMRLLAANTTLTSLNLSDSWPKNDSIRLLAANKTLTSLNLSDVRFYDEDIMDLAHHPRLTNLNLTRTAITNIGAMVLKTNISITHLNVSESYVANMLPATLVALEELVDEIRQQKLLNDAKGLGDESKRAPADDFKLQNDDGYLNAAPDRKYHPHLYDHAYIQTLSNWLQYDHLEVREKCNQRFESGLVEPHLAKLQTKEVLLPFILKLVQQCNQVDLLKKLYKELCSSKFDFLRIHSFWSGRTYLDKEKGVSVKTSKTWQMIHNAIQGKIFNCERPSSIQGHNNHSVVFQNANPISKKDTPVVTPPCAEAKRGGFSA